MRKGCECDCYATTEGVRDLICKNCGHTPMTHLLVPTCCVEADVHGPITRQLLRDIFHNRSDAPTKPKLELGPLISTVVGEQAVNVEAFSPLLISASTLECLLSDSLVRVASTSADEPPPFAAEGKAVAGAVLPQQGHWRGSVLTAVGAGPLCCCVRRAFLASFWFCCRCCCSCLCLCFCSCPRLAGAASCFRRCPLPFLIDLQQFLLLLQLSKPRAIAWAQARC